MHQLALESFQLAYWCGMLLGKTAEVAEERFDLGAGEGDDMIYAIKNPAQDLFGGRPGAIALM